MVLTTSILSRPRAFGVQGLGFRILWLWATEAFRAQDRSLNKQNRVWGRASHRLLLIRNPHKNIADSLVCLHP